MRDTKHCMLYIRSQTPPIFYPKTTAIQAKQRHAQYIALCADYVGCYECMCVFAFCPLDSCSSSSSYRLILDGFRLRITLVRLLFNRAIEHILCWFKKKFAGYMVIPFNTVNVYSLISCVIRLFWSHFCATKRKFYAK